MKTEYITIKEAAKLTGKHTDTIRNLVRKNPKATTKDSKGRVLISKQLILETYAADSEEHQTTPEATEQAGAEQTASNSSEGNKAAYMASDKLIDSLVAELEAKNQIISQQQATIQQIVNQQQQLTGMLMNRNINDLQQLAEGAELAENGGNSTPVNPIEEKAMEDKVIKGKGTRKEKAKKKHWWSR
ncbi:MAG: hypothetical protein EOM00_15705 [Clostridia bacterium]|nr:hypothetical protein [Clostridia bacterium]